MSVGARALINYYFRKSVPLAVLDKRSPTEALLDVTVATMMTHEWDSIVIFPLRGDNHDIKLRYFMGY